MGGKDHDGALRNRLQRLDEDGAFRFQRPHHTQIVDDRPAHIDRRAVDSKRVPDRLDRAPDSRAESAWRGEQYVQGRKAFTGVGVDHRILARRPRGKA